MTMVGRPLGSKNGERMIMPWRPLSWKPVYETMVALHCVGFTNKDIAERFEYSAVQVGNIIKSPEAQRIISTYKDNVRNVNVVNEVRSLADLKTKAIERVSNIILNDELAADHPFRVAEFSASILKGMGQLSDPSSNSPAPAAATNIFIGNDIAAKLALGMEKAMEARLLNAAPTPPQIKTEIIVESK